MRAGWYDVVDRSGAGDPDDQEGAGPPRLGTFRVHDDADVRAVVETAWGAGEVSAEASLADRVRVLRRWRGRLWRRAEQLAETLHRESGLSLDRAILEVVLTVEHLRWIETSAARVLGGSRQSGGLWSPDLASATDYVPVGVVAVLASEQRPLYGPASAVAAALVAGNSVLLVPSPGQGAGLAAYVDCFPGDPTVPAEVLQLVTGDQRTVGSVVDSPVSQVCLFGSAERAADVGQRCARGLVPLTVVPVAPAVTVIAPDADLSAAAASVAAGQGVRDVLVAAEVAEAFDEALRQAFEDQRNGTSSASWSIAPSRLLRALGGRRTADHGEGPRALPGAGGVPFPGVRLHTGHDLAPMLDRLRDNPTAVVSVFSARQGRRIAEQLRVAQVDLNVGVPDAAGGLPRAALGARGYGPFAGDDGLRAFARAQTVTRRRLPLPTGPAEALLATTPGRLASRLVMHLRHSLD